MALVDNKITAFSKTIAALADKPSLGTTALLKQWFDSSPEELRVAHNNLIDFMAANYKFSSTDINVMDYGASGLPTTAVGSITTGTKVLTLTTTPDFVAGQGINLQGAIEASSLQVTAAATVSSNVTVTLNGVAFLVAVVSGDTAIQVATKIRAATYAGWTAGGTAGTDTVTFTSTTSGVKTDAAYSAGTTTATGTMTTTTQGTNDFVTTVSAVNGLVITTADNAPTTFSGTVVEHDDYLAFQAWAAAINASGKGVGIVPYGTYNLNRYKITAGANQNTVTDIIFNNCNGLLIMGYGAKINVKGNFHRAVDTGVTSYSQSVIPFYFSNCTNFELCGFELDGNVDLMTRAPTVVEGMCYGIYTTNCQNYYLHDMYVHHFATDGLGIGGSATVADKQVTIHNIQSLNNARQGMTLNQVRGIKIVSCEFSETGNTGGSYGGHAPQDGVDIEPNFKPTTGIDVMTGMITFEECKFKNNVGSQLAATYADFVERVRLRDCEVIAGTSTSSYPFILSINDGLLEDSYLDLGAHPAFPSWASPFNANQRTVFRNSEFRSTDSLLTNTQNTPVTIEKCRFYNTAVATRVTQYPIYIQNTKCIFRDNYIFLPSASYGFGGTSTYDIAVLIQIAQLSRDNYFETSLNPGASQHFAADYTGSKTVQNEIFLSAGASNNGFRSAYNSVWDNTRPFTIGYGTIGNKAVMANYDYIGTDNQIILVQVMPSTGSFRYGDIAFNTHPAKSGKAGWVRLTTGSSHVLNTDWQPFGAIDA